MRKQKLYESEKQILAAIQTNAEKLALKTQMMEQDEKASQSLAKDAHGWEILAEQMNGRSSCPLCNGKGKGITHGDDFCYLCRGMPHVNANAVLSYAADLRSQSRYRHEQAQKLATSVDRLTNKIAPKLKRALAAYRTDALPLFNDQKPFGVVVE